MKRRVAPLLLLVALATACSSSGDQAQTTPEPTGTSTSVATATPEPDTSPALNELQELGSHNSYHLAPEGAVAAGLEAFAGPFAAGVAYSHLPLEEQLDDYGIRQIELDVFADPEGGLYADRNLLEIVGEPVASGLPELDQPGFKVMHVQDVDFGTTCLTFVACLTEVEQWSSANPDHAPVLILVETKSGSLNAAAAELGVDLPDLGISTAEPPPMTAELFADLEAEVLSVFDRDHIIVPDDIRGDHDTLHEAVTEDGWPTLDESRGKVMFALVDMGPSAALYKQDAPALQGRLFFTSSVFGDADGAFVRYDDPVFDAALISEALASGYLVRTRADADTIEARSGDTTRRDAALASGAQYVSTDYYVENPEFGTGYVVVLTDGPVRCNPVTAGVACTDPDG